MTRGCALLLFVSESQSLSSFCADFRAVSLSSKAAKRHIRCMGIRRAVSWAAIYAIALQTVLAGMMPLANGSAISGDTFSIICRSDNESLSSVDRTPGGDSRLPHGHACDHCILCKASASLLPPDILPDSVSPRFIAQDFCQTASAPATGATTGANRARGPPQSS